MNLTCTARELFRDVTKRRRHPYQNSVDKCALSPRAFAVKQGFSEAPLAQLPCNFSGTSSLSFLQLSTSSAYIQYIYPSQPSHRLRIRLLTAKEIESVIDEIIKSGQCNCELETIVKFIQGINTARSVMCSHENGFLIAAIEVKGDECVLLTKPKHGTIKCFPQEGIQPATCKLECNDGYSMNGVTLLNKTCYQYGWSTGSLVCSAVNCERLLPLPFGYLNCSGTDFNDTCTYSCAIGYSLTGNKTRSCESSGNWSGKAGNCSLVACPTISVNNSNGCQELLYGDTCTARCNPGYVVTYQSTQLQEFELSCTASGEWTNSTLMCSPLLCDALPPPMNGYSNCSYRSELEIIHKYSYLTACAFYCNHGYLLNGSYIHVCEGPAGAWSGSDSVCTLQTCSTALNVRNAKVTCSDAKCRVDCDTGYRATYLNGTSSTNYELTCNASGLWDGVMSCDLVTCTELFPVGNGTISCTQNNSFASLCRYRCNQNFIVDGNLFRTCEANGSWTGTEPKCIERRECSALVANSSLLQVGQVNGQVLCPFSRQYGSRCTVVCPTGYSLVIGGQRLCSVYGTWSSEDTRCEEYDSCKLEQDNCHNHSVCYPTNKKDFRCVCARGYAGNGVQCGLDPDTDFYPSSTLQCVGQYCQQDNCKETVPNSGQEDADGDGQGDACDTDDDNDGVDDKMDNCPFIPNINQTDTDGDQVGDNCDNCLIYPNTNQEDADADGLGDICDVDADNDQVLNSTDNCILVSNMNQTDSDSDGIGDACDNCVYTTNAGQEDVDENGVGDACDSSVDQDKDGHIDGMDNCPSIINPDQLDTDGDGQGDACDTDDDNDGILDRSDGCPLLPFNIGNSTHPCSNDYDGDGIRDSEDVCPSNKYISATDFSDGITVSLDPYGSTDPEPVWTINKNEIKLNEQSDPALVVSKELFGYVEYSGTAFIAKSPILDNDYLGFVFSYQSNRKFYTFLWKRQTSAYFAPTNIRHPVAIAGMHIKVVDSVTGPGRELRNALWHTGSVINQTKMIWWTNTSLTWKFQTSYRWILVHNPANGYIRLRWFEGADLLVDTGDLYDTTFRGGRVGVLAFSQDSITFSALRYRCLAVRYNSNYALSFNGNAGVKLGTFEELGLLPSQNFSIGAWVFIEQCNSVTCTFERNTTFGTDCTNIDMGIFSQIDDNTEDDLDWFFTSTATPSSGTGPSFDHTGNNGCFAHIEGSQNPPQHRVFEGARASLETVCFPSSPTCAMAFWYHMYDNTNGTHIGSLEVEVKDSIYSWYPVFYRAGNHGNQWHKATIDLSRFNGTIKVRFTARFGISYKSDIAIDDIVLSDGCGKADLCGVTKPIFGSDSASGGIGLMLKDDVVIGEISGIQYNTGIPVKPLWQFLSLSYDSSIGCVRWYNNELRYATICGRMPYSDDGTTNLLLGTQGADSLSSALLDEIQIYGDTSSILPNYKSYLQYDQLPTLRAYWKLDKGEGRLITDLVGMREATLPSGGPQWQQSSLDLSGVDFI